MQRKIAFVHYPHTAYAARLETMPFALNSVLALAKAGWNVDLYLWEKPCLNYKELLPDNVTIKYFIDRQFRQLNQLKHIWLRFKFEFSKSYLCVFGLGQIGAYIASIIAKSNQCPFIYLNDEFPSTWHNSHWSMLEQKVVRDATMIVVPDSQRFHPLCKELQISSSIPYSTLPNIPIIKTPFEQVNWHDQLGIPHGFTPVLHAGSIADWAEVPEILSSLPYWPDKVVLVLHSRSREGMETYRKQLSHLEVPGKVIWTSQLMTQSYLNSLVAYSAINFALYRNTGPNIEYIGFSSGKLMRSIVCGCPVIASKLPSVSFVADYGLGILVNHPVEIPDAIKEILSNRETYQQRCLQFCTTEVSFNKAWEKFCDQLKQVVNIDLRQPYS